MLKASGLSDHSGLADRSNYSCAFIDWVIEHHFCAEDDNGVLRPIVTNPLSKIKH